MKIGQATINAAIITAVAAIINSCYNSAEQRELVRDNAREQLALEREQFESNLILQTIKANDSTRNVNSIKFLLDAGLISQSNRKILKMLQDSTFHISLSTEKLPVPPATPAHYDYSTTLSTPVEYTSEDYRLRRRRYQIVPYGTENTRRTFSGVITDALTGRPLAGATVAALTTEAPEAMVTGPDGKYTLHTPYHKWAFLVERPGYRRFYVQGLDGVALYIQCRSIALDMLE